MSVKIALAGNPNCGKTTLFNALTGSNQFVGNWPGVTVEKKEGKLRSNKDDTESIITNERYVYITSVIKECVVKNKKNVMTTSDKIDRMVTNRWLALPIFAVVMFIVYYVSVTTIGTIVTDWTNDVLFGDISN